MKFDDLKFKIISPSPNYDTFRYFPVGGATIRTASHGEREREKERKRKKKQLENMKAADGRRRNGRKSMKMADKGSGLNMYFTV